MIATDFDTHLGAAVRTRREALGLTQARLGKTVGVTFQQIQKYENGKNRIAASTLAKIAAALDIPASELMGEQPLDTNQPGARAMLVEWATLAPEQRAALIVIARGMTRQM